LFLLERIETLLHRGHHRGDIDRRGGRRNRIGFEAEAEYVLYYIFDVTVNFVEPFGNGSFELAGGVYEGDEVRVFVLVYNGEELGGDPPNSGRVILANSSRNKRVEPVEGLFKG
jgi:hypothetical protein